MPITAEQRAERKRYLGSSDMAAILGLDRWRTAADIYWSKVEDRVDKASASAEVGTFLEAAIVGWAEKQLKVEIDRNQFRVADDGIFAANHDGLVRGRPEGVEAKFTSLVHEWGEQGTEDVPDRVIVQCQHQCWVAKLKRVWVPVLMTDRGAAFYLYCVNRNDDLIAALVEEGTRFWIDHVQAQNPPGAMAPPLDVLKARRRDPKSTTWLDEDALALWDELERAKERIKSVEQEKDDVYAALVDLLGSAEIGKCPDGSEMTYFAQNSTPRVDHARFRALAPDVYDEVVSRGQHRVLRRRKPKV